MQLLIYALSAHILVFFCHYQVVLAEEKLYYPPFINTERNNDYFGYMDTFIGFACEATGTDLIYFWKHKDQLITKDTPLKFVKLNSSTLISKSVELDYEGSYQCFAKNNLGTVFGRKASVKFTVVGLFYRTTTDIETIAVRLNEHTAIHCPKHRYSHNVKYIWESMVAGEPVTLKPKPYFFVTNNGTLYFSYITEAHVDYINNLGGIRCTQRATYSGQSRYRTSHIIKLFVSKTLPPKNSRPAIVEISEAQSVATRTALVVLKCGAVGNPVPDLKWFRKSATGTLKTPVVNGAGFKIERFNQYLSIRNITTNKIGTYVCQANNSVGTVERETQINVQDRPQWTVGGKLTNIQPVINHTFIWTAKALGGATFTWYKDGVKLDSAGKFEINNGPGYSSLVIKKMTRDYNGMYQCTAGNEKDTIYSIGRLQVKDCYRFSDGSFVQLMNETMCSDDKNCSTKTISAPIDKENSNCHLNWNESKYTGSNGGWQPVRNIDTTYVTVVQEGRYYKLKIEPGAFEVWSGAILKLEILCEAIDGGTSSEQHCVLLKFENLKNASSTAKPPGRKLDTTTTTLSNVSTEEASSPGLQQTTNATAKSPGAPGQESESSSDKTVAISVSVVLLVLVLLLVVGVLVFHRRRKRSLQKATTNKQGGEPSEETGNTNPAYEGIEELGLTNPGNEYNYTSSDDVARTVSGRSFPLTPNTGGEYATLNEPESAENPRPNYNDTEPKPVTNETKPVHASLEDSGQTGMYQPLEDRRQEYVEGDYQGLVGTNSTHGYKPDSGYPKETPNNPMSNDNECSSASNDDIRSLAKMSPSLSPSNSNNAVYSVDDPESSEEPKTGPYYATRDESNTE